jgi:hypothetical protein
MRSKWLIAALILSLIVNLLLIGFVVGRIASPPPFGPGADPTIGYLRLLRFLPEPRRDELAADVRGHMRSIIGDVRGIRRDQRAVFEAIRAEPFDPTALEAALRGLQQRLTAAQQASHASFVAVVGKLDRAEREKLADAMRRPPSRERGRGHP